MSKIKLSALILCTVISFQFTYAQQSNLALLKRFSAQTTVGVLPTFLSGGTQNTPAIQGFLNFEVNDRLGVSLGYGHSNSTSSPYTDINGVSSTVNTKMSEISTRVKGYLVKTGPFALYGGMQLGYAMPEMSESYFFPDNFQVENEAAYILDRPSPFSPAGNQMTVGGFLGMTLEVLPSVHTVVEVGSGLSLINVGAMVRI